MKWVQINDTGYTHEFELEGDTSTTIKIVGDIETVKDKLIKIFGAKVQIETFEDEE